MKKKEILAELDNFELERVRSEQISIAYNQSFASAYPLIFLIAGIASIALGILASLFSVSVTFYFYCLPLCLV